MADNSQFERLAGGELAVGRTEISVADDFASYVNDIDGGRLGLAELRARLESVRPAPEGALSGIIVSGQVLTDRNGVVTEKRRLTPGQETVLLDEAEAVVAAKTLQQNSEGFSSILGNVVNGSSRSLDEFAARITAAATGQTSPLIVGDTVVTEAQGRPAVENRRVNPQQAETLRDALENRRGLAAVQQSITDTNSFLAEIERGTLRSEAELRARADAGRNGRRIMVVDGQAQNIPEPRIITMEQENLAAAYLKDKNLVREAAREANDALGFAEDIANGRLGDAEATAARLDPSARLSQGQVRIGNELLRDTAGNVVTEPRQVSPENQQVLLQLSQQVAVLGETSRRALANEVSGRTRGATVVARLDELQSLQPTSQAELDAITAEINTLTAANMIVRRIRLQSTVTQQIEGLNNLDNAPGILANIDAFERFGPDDARIVRELRRTLRLRTDGLGALAAANMSAINMGNANYNAEPVLNFALARPKPEDDRYAVIINTAYQLELAQIKQNGYQLLVNNPDRKTFEQFVSEIPIRRSVPGFDYGGAAIELREQLMEVGTSTITSRLISQTITEFSSPRQSKPEVILEAIRQRFSEPEDEPIAMLLMQRYRNFVAARRDARPDEYQALFASEIAELQRSQIPEFDFAEPELGSNKKAFRYLASRFRQALLPVVRAFSNDRDTSAINDFLSERAGRTLSGKFSYIISRERLRRQRDLTAIEEDYLRTVENLSLFNPHLVGLASVDMAVTQVALRNHFENLDEATAESIGDEETFFPVVQVGLGPEGLVAAGELVRSQVDLAADTLYIDAAEFIAGPIGAPNGPAFDLNSANTIGANEYVLPPAPDPALEPRTVRAYAGPIGWYAGERGEDDTRPGSINTTVDYLPTPDRFSTGRYPTNEDEAFQLEEQAAMLVKKLLLQTRLVDIETIDLPGNDGANKRLILERTMPDGSIMRKKVRTANLILSSGLGEPNYGFEVEGRQAEAVLEASKQQLQNGEFPILTDTLGAYRQVADRETRKDIPGEEIIIYGGGNSTDTLLEYISRLFDKSNPAVRNIKKVYIISDKPLSPRLRYAAGKDVLPRNGTDNLVEIIPSRVNDIGFGNDSTVEDPRAVLFDADGNAIRNKGGKVVSSRVVISATGFTPRLDGILSKLTGGKRLRDEGTLESVTLPTDPRVAIADRLAADPGVLIVGTASRTGFNGSKGLAKLAQLPSDAREALLRNGAENAVAIAFRGNDTRAAIRLWLRERRASIPEATAAERLRQAGRTALADPPEITVSPAVRRNVKELRLAGPERAIGLRDDIKSDDGILRALLLQELGETRVRTRDGVDTDFVEFRLKPDGNDFTLSSSVAGLEDFAAQLAGNRRFAAYGCDAISRRPGAREIVVRIGYTKNGRIDPAQTYALAS